MSGLALRTDPKRGFTQVVGVGGIGTGTIIALQGNQTLGRNESRMGQVLDARDYCKLHIVEHYIAVLLGSKQTPDTFRIFAVGNVGSDHAGETLIREMASVGIDTRYVSIDPERRTLFSISFLYPDKSGGNITASNSAAYALSSSQLSKCRSDLAIAAGHGIALCLPEVPIEARQEFLRIATECGSYRVASFTSGEIEIVRKLNLLSQVDLLALNHDETAAVAGEVLSGATQERLLNACSSVAAEANPDVRILSSAGADGVYIFENGAWSHYYVAVPTEAISTAGAGDALLAGTVAGLAAGLPLMSRRDVNCDDSIEIRSAISLGLTLAAFSVTSPHTIHPSADLESLLTFAGERGIVLSTEFLNRCSRDVNSCPAIGE